MKKRIFQTSLFLLMLLSSSALKAQYRATYKDMWVDYDVYEDGKKGMRLHFKFSTYGMKDVDAYVAVYFQDSYGNALKDNNKSFYSSSGDVALYKLITPGYDNADYSDLQMFMPYDELDRSPGKYTLKMDAKLIYKSGGTIQQFTTRNFEYTEPERSYSGSSPEKSNNNSSEVKATYKDIWVDYDVYQDGKKGMRIHVKFGIDNFKGKEAYVAIYFQDKDGNFLKDNNGKYRSDNGNVAVFGSFTPLYDQTDFTDFKLFMPYDELDLTRSGKQDLKMDVDIIYENGDLIEHLKFHDFWYEK